MSQALRRDIRVDSEDSRMVTFQRGDGRNSRKRCQGKAVVRWEYDCEDDRGRHKKGDPRLDDDHARQYRPCQGWGANGTDWCQSHGGSAPQTIAAAKRRLALSAEQVSAALIQIANDERVPPDTRVKAAAQVLDRIGIRLGVDVNLEIPKWQKMIGTMFGTPPEEAGSDEEEGSGDSDGESGPAPDPAPDPEVAPVPRKSKARKASAKPFAPPKFEGW